MSTSLVSIGSFQSVIPNGTLHPQGNKRFDVYNLSKAGAVQIGNILFKYNDPQEEDIVECLRTAGLPPNAYPAIDIFEPRFNATNMIAVGKFSILVQKQLLQPNTISYPNVTVHFTIIETYEIVLEKQAPQQLATGGESGDDVWQEEYNANAMLIDSMDPFQADAIAAQPEPQKVTVTGTRTLKKISANFTINTQFMIRRLQMYFRRCIFKIRCNRRRMMLLLACMAEKQFLEQESTVFNLAALMHDAQGGVLRDVILCAMSR
jgi:hypothetical protein